MSGVIKLVRRQVKMLRCDEGQFKKVVKTAFNQRRKTMRNSLKELVTDKTMLEREVFNLRPEQLSVAAFEELTMLLFPTKSK